MSLWKINEKISEIIENGVNTDTGELSEEAVTQLEELDLAREEKGINWGLYIKSQIALGEAIKEEARKLDLKAKACIARADRLRMSLSRLIEVGETFSDPRVSVKWRKSSKVIVFNLALIPIEARRYPAVEWTPDKTALREMLKDGEDPAKIGARLESYNNLIIE